MVEGKAMLRSKAGKLVQVRPGWLVDRVAVFIQKCAEAEERWKTERNPAMPKEVKIGARGR